ADERHAAGCDERMLRQDDHIVPARGQLDMGALGSQHDPPRSDEPRGRPRQPVRPLMPAQAEAEDDCERYEEGTADAISHRGDSRLPSLSVVVTTFNRCAGLRDALAPLLADRNACEVIVVDDGSGDGTRELLLELAARNRTLRPLSVPNGGEL